MPLNIELAKARDEAVEFNIIGKEKDWTLLVGKDLKSDKISAAKKKYQTPKVIKGTCTAEGQKFIFACQGGRIDKKLLTEVIKEEWSSFSGTVVVTSDEPGGDNGQEPPPSQVRAQQETTESLLEKRLKEYAALGQRDMLDGVRRLATNTVAAKAAANLYREGLEQTKVSLELGKAKLEEMRQLIAREVAKLPTPGPAPERPLTVRPRKTRGAPKVLPEDQAREYPLDEGRVGDCEKILKELKSWSEIKKQYAGLKPPTMMEQLVAYRTKVVLDTLKELRGTFPDLIWKSVGSVTLTSDFDITVSTPTHRNDAEAVLAFNEGIKRKYGVQPGTLFDTNLYMKDYAAVTGDAKLGGTVEGVTDTRPSQPDVRMKKITEAGQDVGSLMKQRRFMSWEDYEDYRRELQQEMDQAAAEELTAKFNEVKSCGDQERKAVLQRELDELRQRLKDRKAATQKQFEEADALYQMTQAKLLKAVAALRKGRTDGKDPILDGDLDGDELDTASNPNVGRAAELRGQQSQILHVAEELEEKHADLHMEVSNKLYVRATRQVRKLEGEVETKKSELSSLEERLKNPGEGDDPTALARQKAALEEEINAKLAVIKTRTSEAVFFAAEAYQTEGPIQHVVSGKQAKDPLKRKEALDSISVNQLMQSFNENMGDFLKDTKHYAKEDPGLCFYKASKYVERMLDALLIIKEKLNITEPLDFEKQYGSATALKSRIVSGLLSARKDLLQFTPGDGAPPLNEQELEEEKRAFAEEEVAGMFRVNTVEGVKGVFLGLGRELNKRLRAAASGDSLRPDMREQASYLGQAQRG